MPLPHGEGLQGVASVGRGAVLSPCGRYRFSLWRQWDNRPILAVLMMNPSKADAYLDDMTISILCKAASRWGYGGINVVNLCPLRSTDPAPALLLLQQWAEGEPQAREVIAENMCAVLEAVAHANTGAVLCAWGALADDFPNFVTMVMQSVTDACGDRPILCLGRTASEAPKHPLARGRSRPDFTASPQPFSWADA